MPAQQTQRYGVGGLYTNPNPQLKAKDGALMRADEVVLRRPGMVEPRPGFVQSGQLGYDAVDIDSIYGMIPFDGSVLYVGDNSGDMETFWNEAHVTTDGTTELPWNRGSIRGVEARKNLYLTTADAIRKVSTATDTEAPRASLPPVLLNPASSASTGPITDGNKVAYRAVIRSKDSNGLVVRSAPSGRAIFSAVGSDRTVTLHAIFLTLDPPPEGATIELYRTLNKPNTVLSVPDELRLAKEHEITAADLVAGYVSIADDREDDDLGRQLPLYTSPSREGIERANIRAPMASDVELFQGSLFASRIKFPHYVQLTWNEGTGVGATGIGTRPVTGDVTNSSNQIINVSSTTGLQVGQLLDTATFSWAGTGPVRITSIVGSTVTVSAQWTGANTPGLAITFVDSIRIESEYFPVLDGYVLTETISSAASSGFDYRTVESSEVVAALISDGPVRTPSGYSTGNRRVVRIERPDPSLGGFEVWATHGDEYDPPLPLPSEAEGRASEQDDFVNGLTWSKADQPEHFMPDRKWLVGNQRSPILRIIKARETLWILKGHGDGIYALTGFGERSGWTVTQRDADTYLLHPDLALAHDDAVYAWTNKGFVRITDAGVSEALSFPIANLTSTVEQVLVHDAHDAADMPSAFAVSNSEEIIVGLPPEDYDGGAEPVHDVFVYHTAGQRWSKWFVDLDDMTCAIYDRATQKLMFGLASSGMTRDERGPLSTARNADQSYIVTVATVTSTAVTINAGSGWTPAVGDTLLGAGGQRVVVTEISSATAFTVHTTGFPTGGCLAFVGIDARVQWLPEVTPGGGIAKRHHSNVIHWDDTYGMLRWDVEIESSTNPGDVVTQSYEREYLRDDTQQIRDDSRAMFTREISYGTQLYQGVRVRQADGRWRIAGLSTNYTPVNVRPKR